MSEQEESARMYQRRLDTIDPEDNEIEILYTDSNRDDVTFYGKKKESIHRWYLLTAAYAPELVRRCLSQFDDDGEITKVLDPFCGTGTTVLESKKQGFDAVGVEFNPVYEEVATTKTTWELDAEKIRGLSNEIFERIENYESEWNGVKIDDFENEFGIKPPHIYNRDRWWHDYVLRDLLAARESVSDLDVGEEYRQFFRVSILSILIEVSNATYNHVSLSYMDEPPENVDALGVFETKINEMVDDLDDIHSIENPGEVEIRRGDSTEIEEYVGENEIDTVITSPPYPNRY
jgi:hypothetical protein